MVGPLTVVTLVAITRDNWKECCALSVREEQRSFLPSNVYSLAEAQFYPDARSLGVATEGRLVGFVLYGRDTLSGSWKIFRLMIDAAEQGRGYGRAALQAVVVQLRENEGAREILICYHTGNDVARALYHELGFTERSVDADGRVTAVLLT